MRKRTFGDAINKYFKLGRNLNQRDTIAVKHTVSGLLKLLYPNEEYTKEAVRRCLEYALEHDERFGIWGGLSERERRRVKRRAS